MPFPSTYILDNTKLVKLYKTLKSTILRIDKYQFSFYEKRTVYSGLKLFNCDPS